MKKSYDRNVDLLVVIFIVLSLIISGLALASTEENDVKIIKISEQNESLLINK